MHHCADQALTAVSVLAPGRRWRRGRRCRVPGNTHAPQYRDRRGSAVAAWAVSHAVRR